MVSENRYILCNGIAPVSPADAVACPIQVIRSNNEEITPIERVDCPALTLHSLALDYRAFERRSTLLAKASNLSIQESGT
jgi:hypothetical protein